MKKVEIAGAELAQMTIDNPQLVIEARLSVIELLLNRLLASHVQMFPDGVSARILGQKDDFIASIDTGNIDADQVKAMQLQLEIILENVSYLLSKSK